MCCLETLGRRSCSLASSVVRGSAGSCRTVASWPSDRHVRSTTYPSGNSTASWWAIRVSLLICRKIAIRCCVSVRTASRALIRDRKLQSAYFTLLANASSVPGRTQTAVLRSATEAKPRVRCQSPLSPVYHRSLPDACAHSVSCSRTWQRLLCMQQPPSINPVYPSGRALYSFFDGAAVPFLTFLVGARWTPIVIPQNLKFFCRSSRLDTPVPRWG